ncbi:MAG: STAS domain-containing protein [Alphaproteobacteria bacterium]|nr:STAS domain-containing protein [Alphaproteobacteria bacterium]
MDWYERTQGATLILQPVGRLDKDSSLGLEEELSRRIDAGATQIVLDMRELEYIGSAGLRAILVSAKQIEARRGRFALCALQTSVREVFDVSGFTTIIEIQTTLDEAIVFVSAPP